LDTLTRNRTTSSRKLKFLFILPICGPWKALEPAFNRERLKMGITPITNLNPLPLIRSVESDFEPLPMERVENSARTGDEKYTPSNARSARGAEDDEPEEEMEELPVEDETEPAPPPVRNEPGQPISFFA